MKQTNDLRSRGSDSNSREHWPSTEGKIIYLRIAGRWMLYGPSAILDGRAENLVTLRDGRTELRRAYDITDVAVVDGIEMATAYPETVLRCRSCGDYHRRCELLQYYGKHPQVRWVKAERWCDCSGLVAEAHAAEEQKALEDFVQGEAEALAEAEEIAAAYREGLA
jgi:hypothetical protein